MTALDGDWVITALWWRQRGEVVPSRGPVERPLTLSIEEVDDGRRAAGFAGCNRYFGSCRVGDATIAFDPLAATRMACLDDELNEQEMALFDALADVVAFRTDGDAALLLETDGAVRAVLVRP